MHTFAEAYRKDSAPVRGLDLRYKRIVIYRD